MKRIFRKLLKYYLIYINRKKNNMISWKTVLDTKTIFEDHIKICEQVWLLGSFVGRGTYLAGKNNLNNTYIGRFCSIATDVSLISGMHPSNTFISTHPSFYSTKKQAGFTFVNEDKFKEYKYTHKGYSVEIGNDVWIGTRVMIKSGVKIGNGAIIGAGAVVTRDIEPYAIYGGVPAKKIRMRFNDEEIVNIQKLKWWENNMEWLKTNANKFEDFISFQSCED